MAATSSTHTARKQHRCGDCDGRIQPGDVYARHVAFPGDDANGSTRPWSALRTKRDQLTERRDRIAGMQRHGTDDLAAYGGIGIRQTARQRGQYGARMDRALGEYGRLNEQIKTVETTIARAERALGRAS